FPAQYIKHKRNKERERLLTSLGTALEHDGKRKQALDAYKRLAAFDPRNFANHFGLASAYARAAQSHDALDAYAKVLAVNPCHLPSVEATIAHYDGTGEYPQVIESWEHYMNAGVLCEVTITLGQT